MPNPSYVARNDLKGIINRLSFQNLGWLLHRNQINSKSHSLQFSLLSFVSQLLHAFRSRCLRYFLFRLWLFYFISVFIYILISFTRVFCLKGIRRFAKIYKKHHICMNLKKKTFLLVWKRQIKGCGVILCCYYFTEYLAWHGLKRYFLKVVLDKNTWNSIIKYKLTTIRSYLKLYNRLQKILILF